MENKRDVSLDIAKGIGIILVVVGHVIHGPVQSFIYLFHVPLFFLISGILYKPVDIKTSIRKNTFIYLIPYFAYLFFFLLVAPKPHLETMLDSWGTQHPITAIVLGGRHLVSYAGTFWFISCLYFTILIAGMFFTLKFYHRIIVGIIFIILAYLNQWFLGKVAFPYSINCILISYPLFLIGNVFLLLQRTRFVRTTAYILSTISIYYILIYGTKLSFNIKYSHYGVFPLSIIFAVSLICCTLHISNYLSKYKAVTTVLSVFGRASLTIFFLSQFFQIRLSYTRLHNHNALRILVGLLCPLAIHYVFNKFLLTQALFLGNLNAQKIISSRLIHLFRSMLDKLFR